MQFTTTIKQACQQSGLGKTKVYELIATGKLDTVKIGRRTLVKAESLRRLLEIA